MHKVFRYVFTHDTEGDVQFHFFTIEEIETGVAYKTIQELREKGYTLIARNAFTGLSDISMNGIYEDDIVAVLYNGLGKHRVELKDGKYTISQFNSSKCRVVGTIFD